MFSKDPGRTHTCLRECHLGCPSASSWGTSQHLKMSFCHVVGTLALPSSF